MNDKREIEYDIADALMGRPQGFSIDEHQFYLYPVTLGKMYLLQRQYESLEIDNDKLTIDVSLEALRLAKEKKEICLSIIAYHTCKTKEEVFDTRKNAERRALFAEKLSDEDVAALMILVLTYDKTDVFSKHLGIDKEQERIQKIQRIKDKNDKGTISTGGLSVFGTLIDVACERYGWTKEYVVWGIDYASLRLMLADKVGSIYLTEEERKKIPASLLTNDSDVIKGTKENMARIKMMDWH